MLSEEEQLACKVAGRRLYDELAKAVILTGVGVGLNTAGDGPAIHLLLRFKKDLKKIPASYEGYEVRPIATGQIRVL